MTTTTTVNEEGVRTTTIGDQVSGLRVTVIPSGVSGPMQVDIEGTGAAVIEEGGLRLDASQAASLASALYEALGGADREALSGER